MSSIIARMVFGVTIAVVAAVVYVYTNRRTANNPQAPHWSRRSHDYEPRSRWEREDEEDDDMPHNRATKRTRIQDKDVNDDDSSISSGSSVDIVKKCGICFELFAKLKETGVEIHSTPCGHLFCIECLQQSLARSKQCPTCRKHIISNRTLRIYM